MYSAGLSRVGVSSTAMEYLRVGSRGHLFTWKEPYRTNVYIIDGSEHLFVVDTFLGPNPMEELKARLASEGVSGKPFVVFNTHADYDHFWGNQSFEGSLIIAHDSAFRRIRLQGEEGLRRFGAQSMGGIRITPPNLVFRKRIAFVDESLEFFYTPGHTGDSASCYDSIDGVLLPGDNIEAPYPYVNLLNLKDYTQSLEEYSKLCAKVIISGHDPPQRDGVLLKNNLDYIQAVASGHIDLTKMDQRRLQAHYPNAVRLAELYIEKSDLRKAREYYEEALKVLSLLEPSKENDEQKRVLETRLSKLI